jgi:glycine betaine/proline transport system permease protein
MAMMMDRITRGFADRERFLQARTLPFWQRHRMLAIALVFMALFTVAAQIFPAIGIPPKGSLFNLAGPLNDLVNYITANYYPVLDGVKNTTLFYFMLPIRMGLEKAVSPFSWGFALTPAMSYGYAALVVALSFGAARLWGWRATVGVLIFGGLFYYGTTGTPWPAFILVVTVLAYQVGGLSVAAFALLGCLFMLTGGVWHQAMLSTYLCAAAVLFSFVLGASIGIWAALNDRVSAFMRPINDTLQTMPLFVFLIPVLMFFQVGEFSALLAIMLYAIVPSHARPQPDHHVRPRHAGDRRPGRHQGPRPGGLYCAGRGRRGQGLRRRPLHGPDRHDRRPHHPGLEQSQEGRIGPELGAAGPSARSTSPAAARRRYARRSGHRPRCGGGRRS